MEEWRDIKGWENYYQVSTDGRVRSCDRLVTGRHGLTLYTGRLLKPSRRKYLLVNFTRSGKRQTYHVHQLVMLTFVGPPPAGKEICHNNGKKYDCRLKNLRYDTSAANKADYWRTK